MHLGKRYEPERLRGRLPTSAADWKVAVYRRRADADALRDLPYELARQAVEVRATANVVEIIHRGRRVASHARGYGRQRFFTVREHMPAAHRAHLEWTPSRLVAWGATIGPSVAELMVRFQPSCVYGVARLRVRLSPKQPSVFARFTQLLRQPCKVRGPDHQCAAITS